MSEDWAAIAQEINEAVASVQDVNDASLGVATLRRRGEQTGPAYNPTYGPDVEYTANGVQSFYTARDREGTTIRVSDLKIMLTGLQTEPKTSDRLVWAGEELEIVDFVKEAPAGKAIYYELQCRR